ncbi:MAG: T9SS type A sorting domain-containing protein [Bacteroidota bacterium]
MKRFPKSLATTLLIFHFSLLTFHYSYAQWEAVNGGESWNRWVTALALKGNMIIAGTSPYNTSTGGIFTSTDAGMHWTQGNDGLQAQSINDLLVKGNLIFAATFDGGIYRSSDNANTWTLVNNALGNLNINFMRVYGSNIYAATRYGLYISPDDGNSWSLLANGLPAVAISGLACSQNTMFVCTQPFLAYPWNIGSVYRSLDYGQSWTEVKQGLTDNQLHALYSMDSDGTYVYLATQTGIVRSSLFHIDWTNYVSGFRFPSLYLEDLFCYHNKIYANSVPGLNVSADHGQTWPASNSGLFETQAKCLAFQENDVFIGTMNGVLASNTDSIHWRYLSKVLGSSTIWSLRTDSSGIYAATSEGVFYSEDLGNHWIALNKGLSLYPIWDIAGDHENFCVLQDGQGIHYSGNQGQNWTEFNNGISIAFNGNYHIRCITGDENHFFAADDTGNVFMNSNPMSAWSAINPPLPKGTAQCMTMAGNKLYIGTQKGLFFTTNEGASWTRIDIGLPSASVSSVTIIGINIYALISNEGVFLSQDSGNSWNAINNGLSSLKGSCISGDGNNLFLSTQDSGVFYSINNGLSWNSINDNLGNRSVRSLTVEENYLFAGTYSNGIFRRFIPEILGIHSPLNSSLFEVFPNPASRTISVNYKPRSNKATCDIMTMTGAIFNKYPLDKNGLTKININSLAPGFYLLRIQDGARQFQQKLVKVLP